PTQFTRSFETGSESSSGNFNSQEAIAKLSVDARVIATRFTRSFAIGSQPSMDLHCEFILE
ncbi:MAG: hypothetical protein JW808_05875, partial [Victivallales bacterium]|nr:hypothetical protein [Victivallales bacterium]